VRVIFEALEASKETRSLECRVVGAADMSVAKRQAPPANLSFIDFSSSFSFISISIQFYGYLRPLVSCFTNYSVLGVCGRHRGLESKASSVGIHILAGASMKNTDRHMHISKVRSL
jgi:hypothetical protein